MLGRQSELARQRCASHVIERSFQKGERLLQQGAQVAAFGIVKVGTVLMLRKGEDGVERPVGMFGAGQMLGALSLLGQSATLSCVALSPGRVCMVDIAPLHREGLVDQAFLIELVRGLAQTNARLSDWAHIMRIRSVAGQLAGTLLQLATLQKSTRVRLPSHTALAALLATSRETIARTLAQLAQHGSLVRHDRWHCEIVRPALLDLSRGAPTQPTPPRTSGDGVDAQRWESAAA